MPYPKDVSAVKLVNYCSGTIVLRMRENSVFLVPVKCTFFCHVSALVVLGHMIHYHVS